MSPVPPPSFAAAAVTWQPVAIGIGAIAIAMLIIIVVNYVRFLRARDRGRNR